MKSILFKYLIELRLGLTVKVDSENNCDCFDALTFSTFRTLFLIRRFWFEVKLNWIKSQNQNHSKSHLKLVF